MTTPAVRPLVVLSAKRNARTQRMIEAKLRPKFQISIYNLRTERSCTVFATVIVLSLIVLLVLGEWKNEEKLSKRTNGRQGVNCTDAGQTTLACGLPKRQKTKSKHLLMTHNTVSFLSSSSLNRPRRSSQQQQQNNNIHDAPTKSAKTAGFAVIVVHVGGLRLVVAVIVLIIVIII